MSFKSYVDEVHKKNVIRWISIEEMKIKNKDTDNAKNQGANDASNFKHCDSLNKYNKELAGEEKNLLKKIKDDVSSKREAISRTILKMARDELSLISTEFSESENFNIVKLTDRYKDILKTKKHHLKNDLSIILNKYIRSDRNLAKFKVLNKLDRDATYPKSKWLFWGTFLIVLVIEAIANSYFYAQGSDLGLLGGVLQASLVALANVVLSFFIGFVLLRYMHHVHKIKKLLAFVGLIISLSLLGFLHLVTAHYRELLIKSPDIAATKVLKETFMNPFNINDFESLILIIIGAAISILVIWKSYRYDDPYPGYGKEWRKWEKIQENKTNDIKKYLDKVSEISESFHDDVEKLNKNLILTMNYTNQIVDGLHSFKGTFDAYCENTKENALHLIRAYRQGYNEVAEQEKLLIGNDIGNNIINYLGLDVLKEEFNDMIKFSEDVKMRLNNELVNIKIRKTECIRDMNLLIDELKGEHTIENIVDEVHAKETKKIDESLMYEEKIRKTTTES